MFLNWNEYRTSLLATVGKFARLQPEFMKGLQQMDKGASENQHLDPKTHELIALAVAVTTRCDGCLAERHLCGADRASAVCATPYRYRFLARRKGGFPAAG